MKQKQIFFYPFITVVLLLSSITMSCLGPKNLVTKQEQKPTYDFVGDAKNGWKLVRQDSLWGYISEDGKQVIPPLFSWSTDFTDEMALVRDARGYGYINKQGQLLRRVIALHAHSFSEGLAAIQIDGKWGYINRKGKTVIKPQFDWAMPFRENRAEVSIGQRTGYIDKNGELIIPAIFQDASPFKNGLAIVRKDFQFGMIDTLGNVVLPITYEEIEPWQSDFYRLTVRSPDAGSRRFGLADAHGIQLLDTLYSHIDLQEDQYLRVKRDDYYGLFDRKGQLIVPLEYTYLGRLSAGRYMLAEQDDQWGALDTLGNVLLPFHYRSLADATAGRIWGEKDSDYILLDDQFKEIKRFGTYNKVYAFSNGYAVVRTPDTSEYYGNRYGYVDRLGNEVVPPQFQGGAGAVTPYGIAVVGKQAHGIVRQYLYNIHDGALVDEQRYSSLERFGPLLFNSYGDFISVKTGKPIDNFPYQSIQPFGGERTDLAIARQDGKQGVIDTELSELLPINYEWISPLQNGRMKVKKNGRWGYADEQFRIRIPTVYTDGTDFRDSRLTEVTQDEKKGIIDPDGFEVIPPRYSEILFDEANNRIYAEKDDGIDIYSRHGQLVRATDLEYIGFFGRTNYVSFRQNGKLGFMDYDFNILHDATLDARGSFYDGLAWVAQDGKGGYINEKFQLVIPFQFDDVENFANGLAKVKKQGREYYINTRGEEVIPTEAELNKRNEKKEKRMRGWIDFSS